MAPNFRVRLVCANCWLMEDCRKQLSDWSEQCLGPWLDFVLLCVTMVTIHTLVISWLQKLVTVCVCTGQFCLNTQPCCYSTVVHLFDWASHCRAKQQMKWYPITAALSHLLQVEALTVDLSSTGSDLRPAATDPNTPLMDLFASVMSAAVTVFPSPHAVHIFPQLSGAQAGEQVSPKRHRGESCELWKSNFHKT